MICSRRAPGQLVCCRHPHVVSCTALGTIIPCDTMSRTARVSRPSPASRAGRHGYLLQSPVRLDFVPEVTTLPVECDADAHAIAALFAGAFRARAGGMGSDGAVMVRRSLRVIPFHAGTFRRRGRCAAACCSVLCCVATCCTLCCNMVCCVAVWCAVLQQVRLSWERRSVVDETRCMHAACHAACKRDACMWRTHVSERLSQRHSTLSRVRSHAFDSALCACAACHRQALCACAAMRSTRPKSTWRTNAFAVHMLAVHVCMCACVRAYMFVCVCACCMRVRNVCLRECVNM